MPNWNRIHSLPPRPLVLAGKMAQADRTSRERGKRLSKSQLQSGADLLNLVAEGRIPLDPKIEQLVKQTLEKQARDAGLA